MPFSLLARSKQFTKERRSRFSLWWNVSWNEREISRQIQKRITESENKMQSNCRIKIRNEIFIGWICFALSSVRWQFRVKKHDNIPSFAFAFSFHCCFSYLFLFASPPSQSLLSFSFALCAAMSLPLSPRRDRIRRCTLCISDTIAIHAIAKLFRLEKLKDVFIITILRICLFALLSIFVVVFFAAESRAFACFICLLFFAFILSTSIRFYRSIVAYNCSLAIFFIASSSVCAHAIFRRYYLLLLFCCEYYCRFFLFYFIIALLCVIIIALLLMFSFLSRELFSLLSPKTRLALNNNKSSFWILFFFGCFVSPFGRIFSSCWFRFRSVYKAFFFECTEFSRIFLHYFLLVFIAFFSSSIFTQLQLMRFANE